MTENNGRTRADEPVGPSLANVDGKLDTYVAWNGETYQGAPPNDWHLASDGQWWSPGTDPTEAPRRHETALPASSLPPPGAPSPPWIPAPPLPKVSPWWRKTWGAVFVVVIGLLILGRVARAGQSIQALQGRQERADVVTSIDDEAIQEYRLAATQANPNLELSDDDNVIRDLATIACEYGHDSADQSEFRNPLRLSWRSLDDNTRSAFEDDLDAYNEYWVLTLQTFCPATFARLEAAG